MTTGTNTFTNEQKRIIIKMLEEDVPIVDIVDMYDFPDADVIYDITYGTKIDNRISRASAKYSRSIKGRKIETSYEFIERTIEHLKQPGKTLSVLEQGCGNGSFTYRLAKKFSGVLFDAIDLSATGIEHAKNHFKLDNTRYWAVDGYKVDSDRKYDLVVHVNVLEHVPNGVTYLKAGWDLLNENGMMVFGFPRRSYWKFWGVPKYLYCHITGREFQTHSFDGNNIDRLLKEMPEMTKIGHFSHGLYPPRRIYYYVPEVLIIPVGKILETIERMLCTVNFNYPNMFSVYAFAKQNKSKQNKELFARHNPTFVSRMLSWFGLPFASLGLLVIWIVSSVLMAFEVITGRKRFVRQE